MINIIRTAPNVDEYLEKHQLIPQFKKAVQKLKSGHYVGLDFKKREPKTANIWSFRINQKYRAWASKEGDTLIVHKIDDHQ